MLLKQKYVCININEFKAMGLQLINELGLNGKELIILKKGIPIARVVPLTGTTKTRRGRLKGLVEINCDIVNFEKK